jgi:hypothetical protein
MLDLNILKNKKLIINVSCALLSSSTDEKDFSKFTEVEIQRDNGKVEKYLDDNGSTIKEGGEKVSDKNLTEFALSEKRLFYKNLLQHQYNEIEHIVILSGAGTSKGIGKENKGLTILELWDAIEKEKKESLEVLISESGYDANDKDLERLLTRAGMKLQITSENEKEKLKTAIKDVKETIAEKCDLKLPIDAPHVHFLNKVLLRPQKFPRTKIFTLNYDTLFEQTADKEKFTVIDGFTFSNPRTFNGKYFDYDIIETKHNRQDKKDSTIPKLFYLFKMHGSLNWKKDDSEIVQVNKENINADERVMIFPQDSKYEHSYEQPYFEMMARFQQTLRTENTLLISIGFSFIDKHISSVILESLKQNPSLNLMVFTYPDTVASDADAKDYQKELNAIAEIQSRVTLVAEKFDDFANVYPENIAHARFDLLEQLNENLKKVGKDGK